MERYSFGRRLSSNFEFHMVEAFHNNSVFRNKCKSKGKADPLQAWSGPEGSRKLRFPDYMTTAQYGRDKCNLLKFLSHYFQSTTKKMQHFSNSFISVRRSTCFRRVFRPSSGAQNCTYCVSIFQSINCYLLLAVRPAAVSSNGLTNA